MTLKAYEESVIIIRLLLPSRKASLSMNIVLNNKKFD